MNSSKLSNYIKSNRLTLLGIGPMSKNCVDAGIRVANKYNFPLILIASRRQIDDDLFGGGYVNNWDTENFSRYVRNRDKKNMILLARDHGGPWQNPNEIENCLNVDNAMASAKQSFLKDILSGFDILHIDTSIEPKGNVSLKNSVSRACELYEYCYEEALKFNKQIIFEIGTEEQSGITSLIEDNEYIIQNIYKFCDQNRIPKPLFIVLQTGTRVLEDKNIGTLEHNGIRIANQIAPEIQIPRLLDLCSKYNILLKEHNADYLSYETLKWHPRIGIHAINIAPEYGVFETRLIFKIMEENNMKSLLDQFIGIAVESGKWKKWVFGDKKYSDRFKAEICGHYVFSDQSIVEIMQKIQNDIKTFDVNKLIVSSLEKLLASQCNALRLIR